MPAHVRRDHHHADCKHDEPTIVDAHGDSVNARDHDLPFEKRFEVHSLWLKSKGKSKNAKLRRRLALGCSPGRTWNQSGSRTSFRFPLTFLLFPFSFTAGGVSPVNFEQRHGLLAILDADGIA